MKKQQGYFPKWTVTHSVGSNCAICLRLWKPCAAAVLRRRQSGITLTREGRVFRQFAEQGLASVSHGIANIEALNEGLETPIRIGALPSVAADFLPDVILKFSGLSPAPPVAVEDGRISALIDRLRTGDLDLILGRMARPETMQGLSFTPLYSEEVVFAAATDHPLAQEPNPGRLGSSLILYPPPGAAIRPPVDRFMISEGIGKWPETLETVSGSFGRSMTLGAAKAIWIISHGVVARDIDAGRMVRLPIDTSAMTGPVGVMARSEEDPTPAMRLFRQALQDIANGE